MKLRTAFKIYKNTEDTGHPYTRRQLQQAIVRLSAYIRNDPKQYE